MNGTCLHRSGLSPLCSCRLGYEGDGFTCAELDECVLETHNCANVSSCTNTPVRDCSVGVFLLAQGSFSCRCGEGYLGSGVSCVDDLCAAGVHSCDPNAVCLYSIFNMSRLCTCNTHYVGNGTFCGTSWRTGFVESARSGRVPSGVAQLQLEHDNLPELNRFL